MKASLQLVLGLAIAMWLTACGESKFSTDDAASTGTPIPSSTSSSGESLGTPTVGTSVLNPPALTNSNSNSNSRTNTTTNTNVISNNNSGTSGAASTDRLEQFMSELYGNLFQRRQETSGFVYWIATYRRGEIGCRNITMNFLLSSENAPMRNAALTSARGRSEYIQLLYLAVLNRGVDQAGYDYWMNSPNDVTALEYLLVESSEFRQRCANYGLRF